MRRVHSSLEMHSVSPHLLKLLSSSTELYSDSLWCCYPSNKVPLVSCLPSAWVDPGNLGPSQAFREVMRKALRAVHGLYYLRLPLTLSGAIGALIVPLPRTHVFVPLPYLIFFSCVSFLIANTVDFNVWLVFISRWCNHPHHLHSGVLYKCECLLHCHLPRGNRPGHPAPAQHEESRDGGQVCLFCTSSKNTTAIVI